MYQNLPIVRIPEIDAKMLKKIASQPSLKVSSIAAEHQSFSLDHHSSEEMTLIEQSKEPAQSFYPIEKASYTPLERIEETNNEGT